MVVCAVYGFNSLVKGKKTVFYFSLFTLIELYVEQWKEHKALGPGRSGL